MNPFLKHKNYFEYFQKLGLYCTSSFVSKRKEIKKIANNSGALILCGGGNIYKIEKKKINFIRDKFEISLMKEFIKKGKPIIAICRGFQFITNKLGMKLEKVNDHINFTGNNPLIGHQNKIKTSFPDMTNIYKKTEKGIITTSRGKYFLLDEEYEYPTEKFCYFGIIARALGIKEIKGYLINKDINNLKKHIVAKNLQS